MTSVRMNAFSNERTNISATAASRQNCARCSAARFSAQYLQSIASPPLRFSFAQMLRNRASDTPQVNPPFKRTVEAPPATDFSAVYEPIIRVGSCTPCLAVSPADTHISDRIPREIVSVVLLGAYCARADQVNVFAFHLSHLLHVGVAF